VTLLASRLGLDSFELCELERICASDAASDDYSSDIAPPPSRGSEAGSDVGLAPGPSSSSSRRPSSEYNFGAVTPALRSARSSLRVARMLSPALSSYEVSTGSVSDDASEPVDASDSVAPVSSPPSQHPPPQPSTPALFIHPAPPQLPAGTETAPDVQQQQRPYHADLPLAMPISMMHPAHFSHAMDMATVPVPYPGLQVYVPRDPWMATLQLDVAWPAWPTPTSI
jgi:hypothetical protein